MNMVKVGDKVKFKASDYQHCGTGVARVCTDSGDIELAFGTEAVVVEVDDFGSVLKIGRRIVYPIHTSQFEVV